MFKNKQLFIQFALFGIVGITTLLIDLTVTISLYKLLNFPAYMASGIGFLSGFFFNFPMNRKRVFNHSVHDRFSLHVQAIMYAMLCIFNLISTSLIIEMLVTNQILTIGFAKASVTVMIAIWNFILFKFFIFSKEHSDEKGETK